MKLIDSIRRKLYGRGLAKSENANRDKRFMNWQSAASVQLLYALPSGFSEDFSPIATEIAKIASECRADKKRVYLVAYSDDGGFNLPFDNVTYINRKQLSFLSLSPRSEDLAEFAGYDADILINLTPAASGPIEYFAAASSARFKTALRRDGLSARYDFLITTGDRPSEPLNIFNTIKHYISKIEQG